MANDIIVTRSLILDAEPARVWEILTDPALARHYMYDMQVKTDWVPGNRMEWSGTYEGRNVRRHGSMMELVPAKTLKYSLFDPYSGRDDVPENYVHVCYKLIPLRGRTELSITLSNFSGNEFRSQLAAEEWDMNIIPKLRALIEQQTLARTIL